MTSRRNMLERCSTHELDSLIRRALRDSVGQVQPPAYVWERIEQQARRRMASRSTRYALIGVWAALRRNVRRRIAGRPRLYVGGRSVYRPMELFSCWEGRIPLSLVYIIEQPMPILRGVGWAT